jgi:hypothetical protein
MVNTRRTRASASGALPAQDTAASNEHALTCTVDDIKKRSRAKKSSRPFLTPKKESINETILDTIHDETSLGPSLRMDLATNGSQDFSDNSGTAELLLGKQVLSVSDDKEEILAASAIASTSTATASVSSTKEAVDTINIPSSVTKKRKWSRPTRVVKIESSEPNEGDQDDEDVDENDSGEEQDNDQDDGDYGQVKRIHTSNVSVPRQNRKQAPLSEYGMDFSNEEIAV